MKYFSWLLMIFTNSCLCHCNATLKITTAVIFTVTAASIVPLITIANEDTLWRPLPQNSTCVKAFGMENWSNRSQAVISSFFHLHPLPPTNTTLRNINIGFGTTGTRFIATEDHENGLFGCHWNDCDAGHFNTLYLHFKLFILCYLSKSHDKFCFSKNWLNELKLILQSIVTTGIQFITDTPMNFIFRELIDQVPNIEVEHSVRDPWDWVLDRVEKHDGRAEFMCDPQQPQNQRISNPFLLLECIDHSTFIYERITLLSKFLGINKNEAKAYRHDKTMIPSKVRMKIHQAAEYYAEYTQMSMNTIKQFSISKYHPICVFDD